MFHACLRTISVTKMRHIDEADTMMLLVICHEADLIVLIGRCRRQDGGVEALHLREPRSAQDDMCQFRRNGADRKLGAQLERQDSHVKISMQFSNFQSPKRATAAERI